VPDPTFPTADHAPVEIEHLVQTIKAEAARLQPDAVGGVQPSPARAIAPLQSAANANAFAAPDPSEAVLRRIEHAQGSLRWPERFSQFPFSLSQKLQDVVLRAHGFLFKKQKVVNLDLLAALSEVTVLLRAQAHNNLTQQQQYETLQQQVDHQTVDCLGQANQLTAQLAQGQDLRHQELTEWLTNLDVRLADLEKRLRGAPTGQDPREEWLNNLTQGQTQLQTWLNHLQSRLTQTEDTLQALNYLAESQTRLEQQQSALREQLVKETSHLRESLSQQFRLSNLLLENSYRTPREESNLLSPNSSALTERTTNLPMQSLSDHHLDAFYAAFEDKFRGSREDITQRLQVYLPRLEDVRQDLLDFQILDLGTGRGEWLELLRSSGYTAVGVDSNQIMAERCRARGLEVVEADAIAYLAELPDQSMGVITGFHIIEHLPFQGLIRLFQEAIRVLCPGGLIIFETPNADNILVGASSFYSDPTHQSPLISSTVRFIAEFVGFESAEILNLHPYPDQSRLTGSPLADRFSDYFYGPQDYAILARRGQRKLQPEEQKA
jgi:SAM-dependent methyltransferase